MISAGSTPPARGAPIWRTGPCTPSLSSLYGRSRRMSVSKQSLRIRGPRRFRIRFTNLDIRIGNPLGAAPPVVTVWGEPSLLPRASVQHYAKTRWHKVFWSGGAPGEIKIDLNYAY